MIFYFSGTGNSKWIAQEIAEKTGDIAESIVDMNRNGRVPYKAETGETLGFVFPVYAWGPPLIFMEFASKVIFDESNYLFGACTCGGSAGNAMEILSKIVPLSSGFSFVMPNSYIIGSDVDTANEAARKVKEAREKLPSVIEVIKEKKKVMDIKKGALAGLKSSLICNLFNKYATNTDDFFVTEKCVSCGNCVSVCPLGSISLVDGKPKWESNCTKCLACINRCPEEAIQSGKATAGRGRYYFEKGTY